MRAQDDRGVRGDRLQTSAHVGAADGVVSKAGAQRACDCTDDRCGSFIRSARFAAYGSNPIAPM